VGRWFRLARLPSSVSCKPLGLGREPNGCRSRRWGREADVAARSYCGAITEQLGSKPAIRCAPDKRALCTLLQTESPPPERGRESRPLHGKPARTVGFDCCDLEGLTDPRSKWLTDPRSKCGKCRTTAVSNCAGLGQKTTLQLQHSWEPLTHPCCREHAFEDVHIGIIIIQQSSL
jgi:hypothetical protein